MEATLNYPFTRKSKNHLDWMINIIKSEKYFLDEGLAEITYNKPAA
jgi:hypothetical protein